MAGSTSILFDADAESIQKLTYAQKATGLCMDELMKQGVTLLSIMFQAHKRGLKIVLAEGKPL